MMRRRRLVILLVSILALLLLARGSLLYLGIQTAREQIRVFAEQAFASELNLPVRIGRVSFPLGLGTVESRVDLNLGVWPLQVLERGIRRILILRWTLPKRQSLVITYFRMQGPWNDPVIAIQPVKSLSQT